MTWSRIAAALGAAAALATSALADLSEVFFSIEATNETGTATWQVMTSDPSVTYDPVSDSWSWSGGLVPLISPGGWVGNLDSGSGVVIGDPVMALNFAVTAGITDTVFTISSGVLSFPALTGATGSASVGITTTESNGDTATITGQGLSTGNVYETFYNGGSLFAGLVSGVTEPNGFGSETASGDTGGFVAIPGSVSSMNASISFKLSALDQGSGTSVYVIVPEPASFSLLALGALSLLRRR